MRTEVALGIPIQGAISIINEYPLGVITKLGKYKLLYDYTTKHNFFDDIYIMPDYKPALVSDNIIKVKSDVIVGSNENVAVSNTVSQVGVFSKGNIVNVIKFDGGFSVVQNPNYVSGKDSDEGEIRMFDLSSRKEFKIPKEYLSKVDDSTPITINTGIKFGSNPAPKTVYETKPTPQPNTDITLEENASFVLVKDFRYVTGIETINSDPASHVFQNVALPNYAVIKEGTNVVGRLVRVLDNTLYKTQIEAITPPPYNDFLVVKGYNSLSLVRIPIEYLTKEVPLDGGAVVPTKNNNKNILMVIGAFIVGYALFNKGKNE